MLKSHLFRTNHLDCS